MNEETRKVLIQLAEMVKRLCQETASYSGLDRGGLVEIHQDAQALIDDELQRRV